MRSVISFLTFVVAVSAWKCDLEDSRYLGQTATLVQAIDVSPFNSTVNMTISGTMKVVDACSFSINNFIYTPELNDTFWYGIRDETYNKGMISNDTVHAMNSETGIYTFSDYPIARSWDDIDTLVLFSKSANLPIAYAKLNLTEIRRIRNANVSGSNDLTDDDKVKSGNTTAAAPVIDQASSAVKGASETLNPYILFACTLFTVLFLAL